MARLLGAVEDFGLGLEVERAPIQIRSTAPSPVVQWARPVAA
jgi:hypothetical protein